MATPDICFRVSGRTLQFDRKLWDLLEGPKPEEGWECNGCSFSPDFWYSPWTKQKYALVMACIIHDWHYSKTKPLGPGWRARMQADAILRRNLRIIVVYQGGTMGESERIAWLYWGRVRLWGRPAWRDAPSFFAVLWEVWRELIGYIR
jgi:hypothetical protein